MTCGYLTFCLRNLVFSAWIRFDLQTFDGAIFLGSAPVTLGLVTVAWRNFNPSACIPALFGYLHHLFIITPCP